MWFDIKKVVLTSGSAPGGSALNAFDNAMRVARIADFNIIRVTSIVPPGVEVSSLDPGSVVAGRGCMLPAVYSHIESSVKGEVISAGVGVGVPNDESDVGGVIFTSEGKCTADETKSRLRVMIEEGMVAMRMVPQYTFMSAVSEVRVGDQLVSAFAAAAFLDEHLQSIF